MLEIKDIVSLDDGNNYAVVSKTKLDGKTYYYLMDIENNNNYKFCYEKKDNKSKLILEKDKLVIKKLLRLFAIDLRKTLKEFEK